MISFTNTADDSWILKSIIHTSVNPYLLGNTGTWLCVELKVENYWEGKPRGSASPAARQPHLHTCMLTYNPCLSQHSCVLPAFCLHLILLSYFILLLHLTWGLHEQNYNSSSLAAMMNKGHCLFLNYKTLVLKYLRINTGKKG